MARQSIYERLSNRVPAIFERFKQGSVELIRSSLGEEADVEWEKPEPGEPQRWPLNAVVTRVHQRYENGTLIVQSGDIVEFAPPKGVVPENSDKLSIDGSERVITGLTPLPGAGEPLYWTAFCAK